MEAAGFVDPNMPEDPYKWQEKVLATRKIKNYGKAIRKKTEILQNAGWNKVKIQLY